MLSVSLYDGGGVSCQELHTEVVSDHGLARLLQFLVFNVMAKFCSDLVFLW